LIDLFSPKGKKDTVSTTNKDKSFEDGIVNIINKIKAGDKLLREEFINSYTPYIIRTVSNLTGKYVDVENSDEFSVVLPPSMKLLTALMKEKTCFSLNSRLW